MQRTLLNLERKMNQQCKVCGEPAAGFHFGAFTCEGCKSFFGRSYNNLNSIAECKNGGECVINKKNRTTCKACRLRKCLFVGMSKSGSRYGRRSNWFKIHCLLQEQQQQHQQQLQQHQQQQQQQQQHHYQAGISGQQLQLPQQQQRKPTSPPIAVHGGQRKDEVHLLSMDDYKNSSSPSISSPESLNSDNSVDVSERRAAYAGHPGFRPLHPHMQHSMADLSVLSKEMMNLPLSFHLGGMSLLPPTFLPPPGLTMFPPYHLYATSPAAPHPLVAHQASNILRHSPAMNDEHSDRGSASSTVTTATITSAATTTTTTTTTATAAAASGVATAAVDDKEDCESNVNNNNDQSAHNHNVRARENASPTTDHEEHYTKRFYLDRVLESQRASSERSPTPVNPRSCDAVSPGCNSEQEADYSLQQEQPMDLSMKGTSTTTTCASEHSEDQESASDEDDSPEKRRRLPIDLTTKS